MIRVSDLKELDVVNVIDGRRLGNIKDIDLEMETGRIRSLILPGNAPKGWGFLNRSQDLIVPWEQVKKMGVDVILIELNNFVEPQHIRN